MATQKKTCRLEMTDAINIERLSRSTTLTSVFNDLPHGLLMECESEDDDTKSSVEDFIADDFGRRERAASCLEKILLDPRFSNDIELKYGNSEREKLSEQVDEVSLTANSVIEINGKTSAHPQERPKLLAKFKLISSSCSKPSTFEYSIKLEESTKNCNSNEQNSPQYQSTVQRCKIRPEMIDINEKVLLNSLARVDGLGYKDLDQKVFLNIKPLPLIWPKSADLSKYLLKLEKYIRESDLNSNPYLWMVKKRLIVQPSCSNCKKIMSIPDEDADNDDIKNFWACGCGNMQTINLPTVFSECNSLRKIASLIYCWSTRDENVETTLTVYKEPLIKDTYLIYTSLQSLCGRIIARDRTTLASFDDYPVELITMQIGNIYILAAMESKTKAIRLASFDKDYLIKASKLDINPFIDKCREWIAVPSQVLIFEKKFQNLDLFGFSLIYRTKKDFQRYSQCNDDNAGGYLIAHLQKMFKNIKLDTLDPYSIKFLLYELEWREKYGYDPYIAFNNIITHMATDPIKLNTGRIGNLVPNFNTNSSQVDDDWIKKNAENCTLDFENVDSRLQPVESQDNENISKQSEIVKVDEYYVDEFYYGWWYPLSFADVHHFERSKPELDILCHLCHMNFSRANICKHIIEHFELKGYAGSGLNEKCNHCFRSYTPEQMHLHRELMSNEMLEFSCRICCLSYCQRTDFLGHMKKNHWPREAPYVCYICRYRSSFQRDIFTHFDKYHSKVDKIICPVCLKLMDYDDISQISELVHSHINDHFKYGSAFSCSRCALTFINESHKEIHVHDDHGDPTHFMQSSEFVPFRLGKKELPFSTVANRIELCGSSKQRFSSNKNVNHKTRKLRNDIIKTRGLNYRIIEKLSQRTKLVCMECKKKIEQNHFTSRAVFCRSCRLKTYCRSVAKNHPCHYSSRLKQLRNNLGNGFQCSCGHSHTNIDDLAKHMVISEHYTCKYIGS